MTLLAAELVFQGVFGSCLRLEATPRFVLEAGRECRRAFAGVGGAGGLGGPDSWRRGAPLLHRGSSGEIAGPTVGVVIDNESSPQDIPGRSGERVQGEAVEREREEAVERLLQWGLGWLLEWQLGWRFIRGRP